MKIVDFNISSSLEVYTLHPVLDPPNLPSLYLNQLDNLLGKLAGTGIKIVSGISENWHRWALNTKGGAFPKR